MWMAVKQIVEGGKQVDNVVNIDAIVRVAQGYIRFVDGTSINVADSFEEIAEVLLKAQGK
jgi:hypothetical protein